MVHSHKLSLGVISALSLMTCGIGAAHAAAVAPVKGVATPDTTVSTGNATYTFRLAAGASSTAITIPPNVPVLVMGANLGAGFRAVGQVTMLRITNSFLEWTGTDYVDTSPIQGFSGTSGTHIAWIDFSSTVDLEVNTPNTFIVHNASGSATIVSVKVIY